jgi:Protein of unknown function (DUF4038)/Putative collagen-binding domain of a collagenase
MKKLLLLLVISLPIYSQISVSKNQKYLQTQDGKPFFWLGDTCWELFHRMNRTETEIFLEKRKTQGFNVIQAVALAEYEGLRQPNRQGDKPLIDHNPALLNTTPGNNPENDTEYDYWDHVDFVFDLAEKKGLYIGLLPTWGDKVAHLWGDGPLVFNPENAKVYGRILAKRYGNRKNIIWILGGDRPAVYKGNDQKEYNDIAIWKAMAEGIKEGENLIGVNHNLMTYHPAGGEYRTSDYIQNEYWMDMNAFQSGHGSRETQPWKWVKDDLAKMPLKPTLDMEPCYEDHPVNPWDGKWTKERGFFNDYDVRARIYRTVLSGAAGVTYGHHQIWQFMNPELYQPVNKVDSVIHWQIAMNAKAANQMIHLKKLMLSRPYFDKIDAQNLILTNQGTTYQDVITGMADSQYSFALFYMPTKSAVTIDLSKFTAKSINITLMNPATGEKMIQSNQKKTKSMEFSNVFNSKDWVLIIDDTSKKY